MFLTDLGSLPSSASYDIKTFNINNIKQPVENQIIVVSS